MDWSAACVRPGVPWMPSHSRRLAGHSRRFLLPTSQQRPAFVSALFVRKTRPKISPISFAAHLRKAGSGSGTPVKISVAASPAGDARADDETKQPESRSPHAMRPAVTSRDHARPGRFRLQTHPNHPSSPPPFPPISHSHHSPMQQLTHRKTSKKKKVLQNHGHFMSRQAHGNVCWWWW